ncbi:alpha-glucuronidase, partial [candidate division WOR-3 bacterium]|nr:alpha-glucuronidase [candidate division WOR-3 bacterium]
MYSKIKGFSNSFGSLVIVFFIFLTLPFKGVAEDGYRLWLRYDRITDENKLNEYRKNIQTIHFPGDSPVLKAAREELTNGISGLLGVQVKFMDKLTGSGTLIVGTPKSSKVVASLKLNDKLKKLGREGYRIQNSLIKGKKCIVIAADTDVGILYG